jgi:hypothetical protein
MEQIGTALDGLSEKQAARIIRWAIARYGEDQFMRMY